MITLRTVAVVTLVSASAALGACSQYGLKGDRGLPPPPENVAYPNLNYAPGDANRPLKSVNQQEKLKADLLARRSTRKTPDTR